MKRFLALLAFALLPALGVAQTKAFIDRQSKAFYLRANMREDHKMFGYAAADTAARKLILFSIFTSDVKGNPYRCPLGSYYDTSGLPLDDRIVFAGEKAGFVKLIYTNARQRATPFYLRRRFVEFR